MSKLNEYTKKMLLALFPPVKQLKENCDSWHQAYVDMASQRDRLAQLLNSQNSAPPLVRPRQILFLHLLRTSGTSLLNALMTACPGFSIITMMPEEFDCDEDSRLREAGMIVGHWSRRHIDRFCPNRFIFTFLRDPVERTLSNYYYYRNNDIQVGEPHRSQIIKIRSLSLREFIESEDPEVIMYSQNTQTYALADDWRSRRLPFGEDEAILAKALRFLNEMDFVGFVEQHEKSVDQLGKLLGLNLSDIPHLNAAKNRTASAGISSAELSIIRQRNQLDTKLYETALNRFGKT